MNFLPSFLVASFAIAGAICAAGPLIIHLLNRRRYRVVQWAAMDFLLEALQRNRKIMQLRDWLLMLLRTLAVLLIGLALAQPFFSASDKKFDGTRPLHVALVIDNSLSMAYESSLEGNLLDLAKEKAKQFIDKLPEASRVSVIPLCGSQNGYSPDPYTTEDAVEAIDKIEVVDRSASVQRALNEARQACQTGPPLAKRIVFLSDQQAGNWRDLADKRIFEGLDSVQLVDVSPPGLENAGDRENVWISDFRIQDGLADIETPARLVVELQYQGEAPQREIQVVLEVDGVEAHSKIVSLEPGLGAREVIFEYVFDTHQPEQPGKPRFVPVAAHVESSADKLPQDNQRHLLVPVVAALPVVFIDQYSDEEEDPKQNKIGETLALRKLLAPVTSRLESPRQLVQVRHRKIDDLTQADLEDARLVVVAGTVDPGGHVELLREYVQQGGQLVIAAGADFQAPAWSQAAWLDGGGILPAPLEESIGSLLEDVGPDSPTFFLDYESLRSHYYFQLAGESEKVLQELYTTPVFSQIVPADVAAEVREDLKNAEKERLREVFTFFQESELRQKEWADLAARGELDEEEEAAMKSDQQQRQELRPEWLLWRGQAAEQQQAAEWPEDEDEQETLLETLAERTSPTVLARFSDPQQTPFLIERQIGRGNVLFVASGIRPKWNTLSPGNAVLLYDRILRSRIQATLPLRNFPPQDRITLPLTSIDRDTRVLLERPEAKEPETLDIGFIGSEQLGCNIQRPLTRGLYRLAAYQDEDQQQPLEAQEPVWQSALTVNGDGGESELSPLSREQFEERMEGGLENVRWVGPSEQISLDGVQIRGQDSWWWLALIVLVLLLAELLILAWPTLRTETPAADVSGSLQ